MAQAISKKNSSDRINFRKDTVVYSNFTDENYYLVEEFKALEKGDYALVTSWDDVEVILEGFEDNEEFEVEELSNGIFAILPTFCTKSARKEFDKMPKAKR